MFKSLIVILLLAVLVGCAGAIKAPAPVRAIGSIVDIHAGEDEAGVALWPMYGASFLGMTGGLVAIFLGMRQGWKMLAAGAGIAVVPPMFWLFGSPLVPYVSVLFFACAALLICYVGWRVYDRIRDDVMENRQRNNFLNADNPEPENLEVSNAG
jgi:hypothetical protein